jgi:hypothetical protein
MFHGTKVLTPRKSKSSYNPHFFSQNGAEVVIYYNSLVYTSLAEAPCTTLVDLFNNMAGNTGLWIGFTAVTCGELLLIAIQVHSILLNLQIPAFLDSTVAILLSKRATGSAELSSSKLPKKI